MSITIYPLTSFGCLKISGPNVHSFMQGQVTCDVDSINDNRTSLTAYCNDKGRISASGYLFKEDNDFYFLTPKALIANTKQKFKQYGIFSNINPEITTDMLVLACIGNPSSIKLPKTKNEITIVKDGIKAVCINEETKQYLFFGKQNNIIALQEELAATKDISLSLDLYIWEQANIDAGVIHIYPETLDKLTPHMVNYHNNDAVSFTKGCFLGQEIIARTQHRGRSKRKLYRTQIENNTITKIGDTIVTDGDEQAGLVVAVSTNKDITNLLVVIADHTVKNKLFINKNQIAALSIVTNPELASA